MMAFWRPPGFSAAWDNPPAMWIITILLWIVVLYCWLGLLMPELWRRLVARYERVQAARPEMDDNVDDDTDDTPTQRTYRLDWDE